MKKYKCKWGPTPIRKTPTVNDTCVVVLASSVCDTCKGREIEGWKKPNNCEKDCFLCKWRGDVDVCGRCRNRNLFAEADTEPTISKMEQVDKDINVRSKDEQTEREGE